MQYRHLKRACARVAAGMLASAVMATSSGAFADESGRSSGDASFSPRNSQSLAAVQPAAQVTTHSTLQASAQGDVKAFLSGKAGDIVVGALNMIGIRYRWSGNMPNSGLDCSGFVRYVFQDVLGLGLPRRGNEPRGREDNHEQPQAWRSRVLQYGARTFSHVGIYIGDNKFVHSPSIGSTIRIDDLDHVYWERRFTGARRIKTSFDRTNGTHCLSAVRRQEVIRSPSLGLNAWNRCAPSSVVS